jgi:protein-S-isoprenylcysteine O-methyltransferase Ste14
MKTLALVLIGLGVVCVPLAFVLQSNLNASNAAAAFAGSYGSSSPAPWIVGVGGVVLGVVGLILLVVANQVDDSP